MPESRRHLVLRTILFQLLFDELTPGATVGSDQFVYWNAADPRRCLAPDALVRLGVPDATFDAWKTWERGAPDVGVEIASESDASERAVSEKLARYHEAGFREVVRFDPDAVDARRLRVWDRVDDDLVERRTDPGSPVASLPLGLFWVVAPADDQPRALRLARDAAGSELVPTRREAEFAQAEGRRAEAEGRRVEAEGRRAEAEGRRVEAEGRAAAERRVAELEAELARRG